MEVDSQSHHPFFKICKTNKALAVDSLFSLFSFCLFIRQSFGQLKEESCPNSKILVNSMKTKIHRVYKVQNFFFPTSTNLPALMEGTRHGKKFEDEIRRVPQVLDGIQWEV